MTTLDDRARELLDAPTIATIATVQPDGRPQLSPVWVARDGDDVLFSTTRGRQKPKNLERDPRVGVLVVPPENPYHYLEVRGTATIEEDPEGRLIQELSQKYTGGPYQDEPGAERLIVRVSPEHVVLR